jgi:serine phosphatase RsbU (regulator of sigma subunit)
MLVIPVMSGGAASPVGCIYLETSQYGRDVDRLVPAVQALAGQIASALHSRDVVQQQIAERVARERADQELALGASIQARFLPREKLQVDGWGLAAALVPARETSGDFYDFFPLSGGHFGIVVADVADKGLGAAFYMALSMTLLRTYAAQYAARYPKTYTTRIGDVLKEVNLQLIHDAGADMFVTLFYGVVNPRTGVMRYANAGHNPPLLLRRDRRRRARELRRTGVPLGMFPEQRWGRRMVRFGEGDALVLYTDGVVEARSPSGEMFELDRLDQVMRNSLRESPQALHDIVLGALYSFMGSEEPFDDITLMVLQREEQS